MRTLPIGHTLVALFVTGAVVGPVTASAAPTQAEVSITLGNATVAAGASAKKLNLGINTRGRFVTLARAAVAYDFSSAAGLVRITPADDGWESCSVAPGRLVCRLPADWDLYGEGEELPAVAFAAAPGARVGAVGEVTTTLTDLRIGNVITTSTIRVAEHAALAVGVDQAVEVGPDSGFGRALVVRNQARKPIAGVVAEFDGSYNVDSAETNFRNCRYDTDGYLLSCTFPTVLVPGRSYRAELPMWVDAKAQAPGRQLSRVTWLTPDEAADDFDPRFNTHWGTGSELALDELAKPGPIRAGDKAAAANVSRAHISVTGSNGADLAVIGSAVPGRVGATVELTATLANNGPADLETLDDAVAVAAVDITLPVGVTVLELPDAHCEARQPSMYRCYSAEPVLPAGDIEEIVFTVRVDRIVADGAGRAALVTDDPDLVGSNDRDDINDIGQLALTG